MSHATNILIQCCDDLMAHVGQIKHKDEETPAKCWVPMLNRLLDTRCQIMAVRDAEKQTPKTKTTK